MNRLTISEGAAIMLILFLTFTSGCGKESSKADALMFDKLTTAYQVARKTATEKVAADKLAVEQLASKVIPERTEMYVDPGTEIHAGDTFAGMVGNNGFVGGPFHMRTVRDEAAVAKLEADRKLAADRLDADKITLSNLSGNYRTVVEGLVAASEDPKSRLRFHQFVDMLSGVQSDAQKPEPVNRQSDRSSRSTTRGSQARTALHEAAEGGDLANAKLTLKNHPDFISRKDNAMGDTPLHLAARNGHEDIVQLLLTSKADVNAKDDWQQTPLHFAAAYGHMAVVELLLANGAEVNAKNADNKTPLQCAVKNGNGDVAELLRKHGGQE